MTWLDDFIMDAANKSAVDPIKSIWTKLSEECLHYFVVQIPGSFMEVWTVGEEDYLSSS